MKRLSKARWRAPRNAWRHGLAWLLAGAMVLVAGWLGDWLEPWVFTGQGPATGPGEPARPAWVPGVLLAAWAGLAWGLDQLLRYLLPLRTLSAQKPAEPHAVVIAPVSPPGNRGNPLVLAQDQGVWWLREEDRASGAVIRKERVDAGFGALLAAFGTSNLAPLLRTLQLHHAGAQEAKRQLRVRFLASRERLSFARDWAAALNADLPGLAAETYPRALDFEDIEAVYEALDRVVEAVIRDGAAERDILVDFTGGQKPTSVALALFTLHRNIRCQYVRTGGDHAVLQYDMAFQPAKRD